MAEAPDWRGVEEDLEAPALVPIQGPRGFAAPARGVVTKEPVPVTLLTGFLGAGKTTLLKHILTESHGHRIAVILNEIGEETGIESDFVQDGDAPVEQWIELTNGCLCCSVKSDFEKALEGLLEQDLDIEHVVVETTGVADPGPIATSLWTDAALEPRVSLDAIITVVDGAHILKQLDMHAGFHGIGFSEARTQVAHADVIILNKMDLVPDAGAVARVEAALRGLNPAADLLRAVRGSVPLHHLLHRRQFLAHNARPAGGGGSDDAVEAEWCRSVLNAPTAGEGEDEGEGEDADAVAGTAHARQQKGAVHAQGGAAALGTLADGVGQLSLGHAATCADAAGPRAHAQPQALHSVTLRVTQPINAERFTAWVDELLWEEQHGAAEAIYRMKGLLWLAHSHRRHMFQAVCQLHDMVPGSAWRDGESRASRVVVIGASLRQSVLQAGLQACCD